MPTTTTFPAGAPCWVELSTSDVARARAFYGDLLGWAAEESGAEFGGYVNFLRDGVRVAGCMGSQPGTGSPDVWSVYLASDDAAKTVEAAASAGGRVVAEAMDVSGLGRMAFLTDPAGAGVGVWEPGSHTGFGVVAEPGAPSWFELFTRSYDRSVQFYRDVFGWETQVLSDTADLRYTVCRHGDDWLAGVMDASASLPDGAPSQWTVYLGVEDADTALLRAAELGGTTLAPAEDTEYGRIATVADPMGAQFRIVAANEAMPARR